MSVQNNERSVPGVIEIQEGIVKFISKKSLDAKAADAIAIVMYALNRPLKPIEIEAQLAAGWHKVSNVRIYLTSKDRLKPKVVKKKEGYVLTGAAESWIINEVIPLLRD